MSKRINSEAGLGDLVEDRVSGYKGVVVAVHKYLQGCDRMSVQPKVKTNGELPEAKAFDSLDLQVLKSAVVSYAKTAEEPGGPAKYMPSTKADSRR